MEILNNFNFIDAAVDRIILPKPTYYFNHELRKQINNIRCEQINILSSQNIKIKIFLIKKQDSKQKPCIIYLHGLSSYCFEGLNIINDLIDQFNFCLYDLRGHGKDKHRFVTYGKQECHDLYKIMQILYKKEERNFVVWGRSMGAVICLQMLKRYRNDKFLKQRLIHVVLDSPYNSFKKISTEIIGKKLFFPRFIIQKFVSLIIQKIKQKYLIDLQQNDFNYLSKIKVASIFISSTKDQLISQTHTQQIMDQYGGPKQQLLIKCQHNDPRPKQILLIVKQKIKNFNRQIQRYHKIKLYKHLSDRKLRKGIKLLKDEDFINFNNKKQNVFSKMSLQKYDIGQVKIQKTKKLKISKQLIGSGLNNKKLKISVYN